MSPRDARAAALRSFGGVEATKEVYRERRSLPLHGDHLQDIRYAIRTLRRAPAFAVAAALVLALAIGANTAMFSVLHAVIFRPLPFPDPDRLVTIATGAGRGTLQLAQAWRDRSRTIVSLAVSDVASVTLTSAGEASQVRAVRSLPRVLRPARDSSPRSAGLHCRRRRRTPPSCADRDELWQQRFGGSRDVLGAAIEINGSRSTIIGVLPAGIRSTEDRRDLGALHALAGWETGRYWSMLARLKPGVPPAQAEAELAAIALRLDPLARSVTSRRSPGPLPDLASASHSGCWRAPSSPCSSSPPPMSPGSFSHAAPRGGASSTPVSRSARVTPASSASCWPRA